MRVRPNKTQYHLNAVPFYNDWWQPVVKLLCDEHYTAGVLNELMKKEDLHMKENKEDD